MSELNPQEKAFLKDLAWLAVKAAAANQPPVDISDVADNANISLQGILTEKRGAFVTLTSNDNLRGCIGYIEGFKPLAEAVADNGRSAAVGDPRFAPVSPAEVPQLSLEISVLTPLRPMNSPDDIQVGKHGILLKKQGRQSVFLPQVATEQGWNLQTTLTQLALKAGLGPNDWRSETQFKVFEAQIF
ncbi:MAG: AmmeMemoRadiSam system protein A [bacterium]|nr:AmmeMemoRadiSam system protein A [bacterium]